MASTDTAFTGQPIAARFAPKLRRVAFAAIAIFILLGPAPGELFGLHSVALREWRMFAAAGVGLLKGTFTLHRADGAVTMSPLEVASLPSYLALPIERRVDGSASLRAFAARICDNARETARLSFEGSIGMHEGWRPLSVPDVCHGPAQAGFGERPPGEPNPGGPSP
jgi:hypothetical protein